MAILADVYLWKKDYTNVLSTIDKLIALNRYALTPSTSVCASRKRRGDFQQANNLNVVTAYQHWKKFHDITDNNPNSFELPDWAVKIGTKVKAASDNFHHKAPVLSKKIDDALSKPVKKAADKIAHWESEGSEAAYREMFRNFEKKLWHTAVRTS